MTYHLTEKPKPLPDGLPINKQQYDNLIACRDIYDPDMSLTIFVYKILNANLKHFSNGSINYTYQHTLDNFNALVTFKSDTDINKFNQFINHHGNHYTLFLLQYLNK